MVEYTNKITGEKQSLDKEGFKDLMERFRQEAKENKRLRQEVSRLRYQKEKAKEKADSTYLGKILKNS